MSKLNYITIQVPKMLFDNIEKITDTPNFAVYRYKRKKGIIFRLPHDLEEGVAVHAFIEHEINLTNTLKTKTLTTKVQVTLVPVSCGVFDGFEHLEGNYHYDDEEDWGGYEFFKPNYESDKNVRRVAPLPPKVKTEWLESLNELLFKHHHDMDVIRRYVIDLGCQTKELQQFTYVPVPTESDGPQKSRKASQKSMEFFDRLANEQLVLLPEAKGKEEDHA